MDFASRQTQPRRQDLWDRIWKDKRGRIVIWQWPNVWLIAWAITTVVSLFFTGTLATVLSWAATLLLGIWAVVEMTKGVNYFRRALGLLILFFVVASIIKSL